MRRSTDGGNHFGPAQKINKAGQWADNPDPDDLLPNKKARVPASTSAPLVLGGQNWSNTDISTKSWNPNSSFFSSGSFFGDYNGFAVGVASGVMYPIWTDGRDTPGPPLGQTDVWTNVELPTP